MHIKASLKMPFQSLREVLLGTLFLHPFLHVFLGMGYVLLWGKAGFQGKTLPPPQKVKELFTISMYSLLIFIIYFLPVLILLWVVNLIIGISFFDQTLYYAFLRPQLGIIGYFLDSYVGIPSLVIFFVLLFGFLFNLLQSAILLSFFLNDNFSKAFSFRDIFKIGFNKKFVLIWLSYLPFDYIILLGWPYLVGKTILGEFLFSDVYLVWAIILGFVTGFLRYIYSTTYYTLLGQAIRDMNYKLLKLKK
ncbi:MAG: DUF4013 domain-containing protein [Nanoarchaeota archaeon]